MFAYAKVMSTSVFPMIDYPIYVSNGDLQRGNPTHGGVVWSEFSKIISNSLTFGVSTPPTLCRTMDHLLITYSRGKSVWRLWFFEIWDEFCFWFGFETIAKKYLRKWNFQTFLKLIIMKSYRWIHVWDIKLGHDSPKDQKLCVGQTSWVVKCRGVGVALFCASKLAMEWCWGFITLDFWTQCFPGLFYTLYMNSRTILTHSFIFAMSDPWPKKHVKSVHLHELIVWQNRTFKFWSFHRFIHGIGSTTCHYEDSATAPGEWDQGGWVIKSGHFGRAPQRMFLRADLANSDISHVSTYINAKLKISARSNNFAFLQALKCHVKIWQKIFKPRLLEK